ncbi:MAG: kynurenine 3-monooxygenase [Saprospiraceae bacterium]|jgi:kynurenine 3-monooxygenase|tara:strand:+ start:1632 stop:2984 length:1353 start_codon:yes stop_codon:yes gene_type:complete
MEKKKIVIVGAGLCGTLLAIRMAQRGYEISLHEKRSDMRNEDMAAGRSINLALSSRGLMALDRVGLKEKVLEYCIPMHGRMIHTKAGDTYLSPYSGRSEDYINSVSRGGLNCLLLDEAEKMENVKIHFNSACKNVDLKNAKATFKQANEWDVIDTGDILIGTDGAGSVVRRSMMSRTTELLFNYSQDFLRHGYKELSILPAENGGYRIEKNALHIWPRGSFMIIALPNMDGSFTLTMFHPYGGEAGFNTLNKEEILTSFFEEYYPDLLPHIPHYIEEYESNPVGTLGTIKCYPWQAYGKSLIMGDAAHAIVPFYGQGMNASFEDVRVFDDMLEEHGDSDWNLLFEKYQDSRAENANAIADLAIDNFHEMQDKVNDPDFQKKRKLEMKLEQEHPEYYSKYSLVTFKPEMSYKEAMKKGRSQDNRLLEMVSKVEDVQRLDTKLIINELLSEK